MIKYKLTCKSGFCPNGSEFDGWFQNIDAYEKQKIEGFISCPICGSDNVEKMLTTPNLKTNKNNNAENIKNKINNNTTLKDNFVANDNFKNISTILRTIKKEIQKNSTFVGDEFVSQVKSMKEGKMKEKPIHGHGSNKDIQELRDEGIEVVNIPWISDDH